MTIVAVQIRSIMSPAKARRLDEVVRRVTTIKPVLEKLEGHAEGLRLRQLQAEVEHVGIRKEVKIVHAQDHQEETRDVAPQP